VLSLRPATTGNTLSHRVAQFAIERLTGAGLLSPEHHQTAPGHHPGDTRPQRDMMPRPQSPACRSLAGPAMTTSPS
jgi:hypothetical protein